METIKFDKLNVEIEVKTDEVSLFEIKELRDRIQVFFEDKEVIICDFWGTMPPKSTNQ